MKYKKGSEFFFEPFFIVNIPEKYVNAVRETRNNILHLHFKK